MNCFNNIFLCIILFFYTCEAISDELYSCSDGKIWECVVVQVEESPILTNGPNLFQNTPRLGRRKKQANLYFSYLNKVNPEDGSIYIAGRLKIELQQLLLENATGISIQILPKDDPITSPIYYQAQMAQRRPIPNGYTVDFTIPIENQLQYEKSYSLKFDLLPLHLGISSQKTLFVPSYDLPDIDCKEKFEPDEKRQYVTSRFTSSFRQLTFYPLHSTVNLSFYAAPKSYCLSYNVQVELGGSYEVESHVVHASQMQQINNGSTLVGTVTLTKISADKNYTIRIIPTSPTNSCVCFDCSCVFVQSELFSLSRNKTIHKETKSKEMSAVSAKQAQFSNEQVLKIQIVDDRSTLADNNLMFLLIVFFCVLSLTFISIALIILLCRSTGTPNSLILVKSARISQQEKPLLTSFNTNQTVLLLNAEPSKSKLIKMLAKILENSDPSLNVVCMENELSQIEKNLQMWCNNILIKADKILLFHSNRAAYLISNKMPTNEKQINIIDNVFQTFMSLIRINDSRFIHACWDNERVSLFPHSVETFYSIPRNIQYIFNGLNLSLPTLDQCALFQEEYQKTIEPVVEEDKTVPKTVTLFNKEMELQTRIEKNFDEDNDTFEGFESGYKTVDSIEEQLHGDENDKYKDLISIGSSSDSGLII